MIRRILFLVLLAFAASAAAMIIDWTWFHGLKSCFGYLERHTGFWALAIFCAEILAILAVLWQMTRWLIVYRAALWSHLGFSPATFSWHTRVRLGQ